MRAEGAEEGDGGEAGIVCWCVSSSFGTCRKENCQLGRLVLQRSVAELQSSPWATTTSTPSHSFASSACFTVLAFTNMIALLKPS